MGRSQDDSGDELDAAIDAGMATAEAEPEEAEATEEAQPTEKEVDAELDNLIADWDAERGQEDDPEDEDDDEDEPLEEESSDEDEEEEGDDADFDEDEAIFDAMAALRNEGVPMSVLKSTPKAKLISWGQQAIERAKHGSGEGADTEDSSSDDDSTPTKGTRTASAAQGQDDSGTREEIARIADEFGVDRETAARAFGPLIKANTALRSELKELKSQVDNTLRETRAREGQAVIDSQIRRLQKRYPSLRADADARTSLINKAKSLAKTGDYAEARSLFDEAAMLALGKPKRTDMARLRRNGLSKPPIYRGGGSMDMEPGSEDDWWATAMDMAERGHADKIGRMKPPKGLLGKTGRR